MRHEIGLVSGKYAAEISQVVELAQVLEWRRQRPVYANRECGLFPEKPKEYQAIVRNVVADLTPSQEHRTSRLPGCEAPVTPYGDEPAVVATSGCLQPRCVLAPMTVPIDVSACEYVLTVKGHI